MSDDAKLTGDDVRAVVAMLASIPMQMSLEEWQAPSRTLLKAADEIDRMRAVERRNDDATAWLVAAYGPDYRNVLKQAIKGA